MKNTTSDKRKGTAHRLAIIEGHLRKVRAMVDHGDDCLQVIHQSRAVQQALKKFDEQILQDHLRVCVARDAKTPGGGEKTVAAVLEAFKRL